MKSQGKKDSELISIVVPIYNSEDNLKKCINSLIDQSYENIEIILVNDGSTDCSLQIAQGYAESHPNIRLIDQINEGVSVARNKGMAVANGVWIIFVDSDDWIEQSCVQLFYNASNKKLDVYPDIIISDFFLENTSGIKIDSFFNSTYDSVSTNRLEYVKSCIAASSISNNNAGANLGVPWAKMYRKEFIIENNFKFVPGLKRMQDMIFNLHAFYNAKVITKIDAGTYHYSLLEGSATNKFNPSFVEIGKKVLDNMYLFTEQYTLGEELSDYLNAKSVKIYFETVKLSLVHFDNHDSFFKKLKEMYILKKDPYFKKKFKLRNNKVLNIKQALLNSLMSVNLLPIVYLLLVFSSSRRNTELKK